MIRIIDRGSLTINVKTVSTITMVDDITFSSEFLFWISCIPRFEENAAAEKWKDGGTGEQDARFLPFCNQVANALGQCLSCFVTMPGICFLHMVI